MAGDNPAGGVTPLSSLLDEAVSHEAVSGEAVSGLALPDEEEESRPGLVNGATGSLVGLQTGDLFVALPFADVDAHRHVAAALEEGASLALVDEGWPGLAELGPEERARCVGVPGVLPAFRRFAARFRREVPCPVVAVIGSSGKTTTKDMLVEMVSHPDRSVVRTPGTDNGFLGLPQTLCDRAMRRRHPPEVAVLEIGIDARGAMAAHARLVAPDLVVVTALGAEHLNGLEDADTATEEELSLLREVPGARRVVPWEEEEIRRRPWVIRKGDVVVAPRATAMERALSPGEAPSAGEASSPQQALWPDEASLLSYERASTGDGSLVTCAWRPGGRSGEVACRVTLTVRLPGAHNARNAALAAAAALSLGRGPADIEAGFREFAPPAWRSTLSRLARGALLFDDCFNATPPGMEAALTALADPEWAGRAKVAVLGDMLDLGPSAPRCHVALAERALAVPDLRLYLFGAHMTLLAERLSALGHPVAAVAGPPLLDSFDPGALVGDIDLPPGAVVLVKGSRGMRMERVVRALESRFLAGPAALHAPPLRGTHPSAALVTGSDGAPEATAMLAAALRGPGAPPTPHVVVEVAHHEIAALLRAPPVAVGVAVFTGLSASDKPPHLDIESHLAQKAQLFLRSRRLGAVVLFADDPASDLIAEILPPGTRVLRYGTSDAPAQVDLRVTSMAVSETGTLLSLSGPAAFPERVALRTRSRAMALGAAAALLAMHALGGAPREAILDLC